MARRGAVTVVAVALLGGASAAFALTEALKLEGVPVTAAKYRRSFSPTCHCRAKTAKLTVKLKEEETLDAAVVDADGDVVRSLVTGLAHGAGTVSFRWDGKDDDSRVVPDGGYRLQLELAEADRSVVLPRLVEVDTRAPEVTVLSVEPRALSGESGSTTVEYRTSERASPTLLVDGTRAGRGAFAPAGNESIAWDGSIRGRPARRGAHELVLRVRDRAGNVASSEPVVVRVVGTAA